MTIDQTDSMRTATGVGLVHETLQTLDLFKLDRPT